MMNKTLGILTLAAALSPLAAAAQQSMLPPPGAQAPFYFGAGIGSGHLKMSGNDIPGLNNAQIDGNDTTYTVRGGWRFSPYGAVEVGYYDFGRYNFHGTVIGNAVPIDGSAKAQSVGISLVGILPINNFDLYGRVGYAHSELKLNANTSQIAYNQKDQQDEATYGVGGRWTFAPNWALFAEWEKNDRIKVDSYVGGVDFRF
jgi:OmpA-OmpF porin, OOP family